MLENVSVRSWGLHLYRWSVLAAIVWLVHDQHARLRAREASLGVPRVSIEVVRDIFPRATSVGEPDPMHGGRVVHGARGNRLGWVLQTSPRSDTTVGFSGPTNTLVGLDVGGRVVGLRILESKDTKEHVALVVGDGRFLHSLDGKRWDELGDLREVDAVSGATLTSLAIMEGVILRMGGAKPSLRFPSPVRVGEARRFFPGAERLRPSGRHPSVLDVLSPSGRLLGKVLRTAPWADDLSGYQGPTDTLIALGPRGRVLRGISIRSSYDNEPYVGDVASDRTFAAWFSGRPLEEFVLGELAEGEMEGVSGATMTSRTVARGVTLRAERLLAPPPPPPAGLPATVRGREIGTLLVIAVALAIAFTRLRARRGLRIALQVALVLYLGLTNGHLVSQALFVGWARHGVPWSRATALVLLTAAAFLVPLATPRQPYCHHLCPHGALQELLGKRVPLHVRVPRRLHRLLRRVPAMLAIFVALAAVQGTPFPFASIEPFDAYVVGAAATAALALAVLGLVASLFVPMAYCRYGCPTGALLEFLRRSPARARWSGRDGWALLTLAAAATIALVG